MHTTPATREDILQLLELALLQEQPKEVTERLQWFLRYAEHASVSETCRHFAIARTTFYRWLKRFDPANLATLADAPVYGNAVITPSCVVQSNAQTVHNAAGAEGNTFSHNCLFCRVTSSLRPLWKKFGISLVLLSVLLNLAFLFLYVLTDSALAASSWGPTLLVNTEAFQVIDDSDSSSDIYIKFGATLAKTLTFERTLDRFNFSDDVYVTGNLDVSGTMSGSAVHAENLLTSSGDILSATNITINSDNGAADAVLTFGNDAAAETITFSDSTNRFELSDDIYTANTLTVDGGVTFGSTMTIGGVAYTFPAFDGSASGRVLATDSAGNLSWTAAGGADTNTTYVAGQGLTLTADSENTFKVNSTLTGTLVNFIAVSGATLHAQDLLTSSGNILSAANITINSDNGAADAVLTFGNDAAAETVRFSDTTNGFIFSDDVEVQGTLSGANLNVMAGGNSYIMGSVGIGKNNPGGKLDILGNTLTSGGTDDVGIRFMQTLNDTGGPGGSDTYTAFKMNLTGSSLNGWNKVNFADFRKNNVSKFVVNQSGSLSLSGTITLFGKNDASTSDRYILDTKSQFRSIFLVNDDKLNTAVNGAGNSVIIGSYAGSTSATGDDNVVIGAVAAGSLASGESNIIIGTSALQKPGNYNIAIGKNAGNSGDGTLDGNVFIGTSAKNSVADIDYSVAIGYESQVTASNQLVIGSDGNGSIDNAYFGQGTIKASPTGITINATGGNGTNNMGGHLRFAGGKGTGSASGGSIIFQTSDAEASSSTLQSLTTKMILDRLGNVGINDSTPQTRLDVAGGISGTALKITGATTLGSSVTLNGVTYTFPENDGSSSGKVLATDSAGNLSWTAAGGADTNTTYVAGQGLTLTADSENTFKVNATLTGTLLKFGTISGALLVHARDKLSSSGTLLIGGATTLNGTLTAKSTASFQNTADSTTGFQVLDADGGTPIFNVDTTNERLGIGTDSPQEALHVAGNLYINPTGGAQDYIVNGRVNVLTFQGQSSATDSNVEFYSKDGDGTDSVGFNIFGKGTPADVNNAEYYHIWYDASNAVARINTESLGSGTDRDIRIGAGSDSANHLSVTTQGNIGINDTTPQTRLDVAGGISGTALKITGATTLGSTVNIGGVTYTFPGADGSASGKVLATDSAGNLSWTAAGGADTNTTYVAGQGLTLTADSENTFKVNSTLTGTLVNFIAVSGATLHAQDLLTSSGNILSAANITINSDNGTADAVLTFGNDAAAETVRFSDTTNGFIFSDDVEVQGTLSGANLNVMAGGNSYIMGSVGIGTASPGTYLHVFKGSAGADYVAESNSVGIYESNVDSFLDFTAPGNKTAGFRFDVGADSQGFLAYDGASAGATPNTFRFGAGAQNRLVINGTSGNVGIGDTTPNARLDVAGGITGSALQVTGTARFDSTVRINGVTYTFPAFDGSASGKVLKTNSAGKLSWSADSGSSYTAGQGLTLGSSTFKVNSTLTGTLLKFSTVSGALLVHARDKLSSSGTLLVNGAATFNSTVKLGGVTYTFPAFDGSASGKVLKTNSAGKLSWSDDNTGGGGGISFTDAASYFVNDGGDTMTGGLLITSTNNGALTVENGHLLEVAGAMSGASIHAQSMLTSSGQLIVKSSLKKGSGAVIIVSAERQTGAYIFASGAAVLALDSPQGSSRSGTGTSPHIAFGYNGYFDVKLFRSGYRGSGELVLRTEANGSILNQNVFRIVTSDPAQSGFDQNIFRFTTSGNAFADGSFTGNGADYAEWFYSDDTLTFGDTVCIDTRRENSVRLCEKTADENLMGVVSSPTQAAFIGNAFWGINGEPGQHYYLIALLGQVKTLYSTENGTILPGDSLTSASVKGLARRADAGEPTLGVALEGSANHTESIKVLISRKNSSLTAEKVDERVRNTVSELGIDDEINTKIEDLLLPGGMRRSSDERLKINITTLENSLDIIQALRPVKYHFKPDYLQKHPAVEDREYFNFIAQEFRQVLPDSVYEDRDGFLAIDTSSVQPYLVGAVQELATRVENLESKLVSGEDAGSVLSIPENGSIEVTAGYHQLASVEGRSQSMLSKVEGGVVGQVLVLKPKQDQKITLRISANLLLTKDFEMQSTDDMIVLLKVEGDRWVELTRSQGKTSDMVDLFSGWRKELETVDE